MAENITNVNLGKTLKTSVYGLLFMLFLCPASAWGVQNVTNTDDAGPGSLRAAVTAAGAGETIQFDASLAGQTISLLTPVTSTSGSALVYVVDGGGYVLIGPDATYTGNGLIQHTAATANRAYGGGLFVAGEYTGDLNQIVTNRTASATSATGHALALGGGIRADNNVGTFSGTISGNSALATVTAGAGNAQAQGGGASFNGTLGTFSGTASGNRAVANGVAVTIAQGGGVHAYKSITNLGGVVTDNLAQATADDPNTTMVQALGGGVYVREDIGTVSGTISDNRIVAEVSAAGGAPSYAAAYGGGVNASDSGVAATKNSIGTISGRITGNTVEAYNRGAGQADARGGGVFSFNHIGLVADTADISGNALIAEAAVDEARAYGGGIFAGSNPIATGGIGTLAGSVSRNTITITNTSTNTTEAGTYASGAGVHVEAIGLLSGTVANNTIISNSLAGAASMLGAGVNSRGDITEISGTIIGNTINAAHAESDITKRLLVSGVGAYVENHIGTISGKILNNSVVAENTAGRVDVFGGGVRAKTIGDISGEVSGNSLAATGNSSSVWTYASGGGVRTDGGIASISGTISHNSVNTSNIWGTSATGGGVWSGNGPIGDISGQILSNSLQATSQAGAALALGGGAGMKSLTTFSGLVSGNTASANSDSSLADSLGGGLYIEVPDSVTIIGGTFENNRAVAASVSSTARAEGGAIFLNTAGPGNNELTLAPTAGDIVFRGNTVSENGVVRPNDIHFGRWDLAQISDDDAELVIAGGTNAVYLPGGVTVDMNNGKAFTFTKSNAGRLLLGGDNDYNAAGGATVGWSTGAVALASDFTMHSSNSDPLTVNTGAMTLAPELGGRSQSLAMFDVTAMTAAGTTLSPTYLGFGELSGTWLMVTGATLPGLSDFTVRNDPNYFLQVGLTGDANNIYITANNAGLTQWLGRYPNILSDRVGLDGVFQQLRAPLGLPDQEAFYRAVRDNIQVFSLEAGVSQALVGLDYSAGIIGRNWNLFQQSRSNFAYSAGEYDENRPWYLWASYLGQRLDQDRRDRYFGYDSDLNGATVGLGYDLSPQASVGFYLAYGTGDTDYRELAAKVDSDIWQFGLLGNFQLDNGVHLKADLNYARIGNDSRRRTPLPQGWTGVNKASFDQAVYGFGLAGGYDFRPWDGGRVTPYLELRYQHLEQDSFTETGSPWAMRLDGVDADSFTSALGVELEHRLVTSGGVSVTPSFNAAWVHEFGDEKVAGRNAFVGSPGWYDVSSVSQDRDRARLGAGLAIGFMDDDRLSLKLGYQAEIGAHTTDQSYYGGLEFRF